jgi:hypothetical protein
MANGAMVPGQFYPAQFDLTTAADQMRAMREQATLTADQVRRATVGLRRGLTNAIAPVTDAGGVSLRQQQQASRLAQQTMSAQQAAAGAATAQWEMVASPVSGGFADVASVALSGRGHVGRAWNAMGRNMVASLVRTHAEALLMGGEEGSLLGGIFGSRKQGGGLAGLTSGLLFGQSYDAGIMGRAVGLSGTPLAGGGLLSPLASMVGLGGGPQAEMLAAQMSTGGGGDLAKSLSTAWSGAQPAVDQTMQQAFQNSSGVVQGIFSDAFGGMSGMFGAAGGGGGGGLGGIGSLFGTAMSVGSIFGFARGGIVPSAAGGMIVGPGHGTLAMLHPREMVLPANISSGLQRMVGSATGPTASHNINVNYHVNALDARGVRSLLQEHGDTISNILQRSLRNSPRGGSGFQIT